MKKEFVHFALQKGVNRRALCRHFKISQTCGYKLLKRYEQEGEEGLKERSRRPHHQPHKTEARMEARIVEIRDQYPDLGGRKIQRLLRQEYSKVPSASTITEVLRRHGRLEQGLKALQAVGAKERFEHAAPNDLWQMDFKGPLATQQSRFCYPLSVLDDHSRFLIGLAACADQKGQTVREVLYGLMECYGMPLAILCDNGSPWGGAEKACPYSALGVWLLALGVDLWHGRPYHPQTQGKVERFHRTMQVELLNRTTAWRDLPHCQQQFEGFRETYNFHRPHQALDLDLPAQRYQFSTRPVPKQPREAQYLDEDQVRKVAAKGEIKFQGKAYYVGQAFGALAVALRATDKDGCYDLFYDWKKIGFLDLNDPVTRSTYRPALCAPVAKPWRA